MQHYYHVLGYNLAHNFLLFRLKMWKTKDSHSLQIIVQLFQHHFQVVEPARQIVGHLVAANTHTAHITLLRDKYTPTAVQIM